MTLALAFFFPRWGYCSEFSFGAPLPQVGTLKKQKEDRGQNGHCFIFWACSLQSGLDREERGGFKQLEPGSETKTWQSRPHSELGGV